MVSISCQKTLVLNMGSMSSQEIHAQNGLWNCMDQQVDWFS